jgi:23S rRNA pseudouridine2605 synthase
MDVNTSGLMLFTNNGELANYLMHPRQQIERVYAVRVLGKVDAAIIERLLGGVHLEDGISQFNAIKDIGGQGVNHWYEVILKQGRKREVRRLWESQGLKVSRLMRIRFGPIGLPKDLRRGKYVILPPERTQFYLDQFYYSKQAGDKTGTNRKLGAV